MFYFKTALLAFIVSLSSNITLQASWISESFQDDLITAAQIWRNELEREIEPRLNELKRSLSITSSSAIIVADEDGYPDSLDSYLFGSSIEEKRVNLHTSTLFDNLRTHEGNLVTNLYGKFIISLAALGEDTAPLIQVSSQENEESRDYFIDQLGRIKAKLDRNRQTPTISKPGNFILEIGEEADAAEKMVKKLDIVQLCIANAFDLPLIPIRFPLSMGEYVNNGVAKLNCYYSVSLSLVLVNNRTINGINVPNVYYLPPEYTEYFYTYFTPLLNEEAVFEKQKASSYDDLRRILSLHYLHFFS